MIVVETVKIIRLLLVHLESVSTILMALVQQLQLPQELLP